MDRPALPTHVAIIMDGNGRWAERRGMHRLEGHAHGARAVREVVTAARELGIRYLTLFAFSTENWARPAAEVAALMAQLEEYLRDERAEILANDIRLTAIGELERLPPGVRAELASLMDASAQGAGMTLCLALSYGGREELCDAARRLADEARRGLLEPGAIDKAALRRHLWTSGMPDPDLLIRTSGELRISNFLLYELAYTELYFTDTLWPDFGRRELAQALEAYARRERRFGRVSSGVGA